MIKQVVAAALTGSVMFITSVVNAQRPRSGSVKVPVQWVNSIDGDFSFTEKWSYGTFVYKDKQGQFRKRFPSSRIEGMFDADGRLYKDSAEAFYKLVDTTHIPHGILWESDCYPKTKQSDDKLYVVTSPTRVYVSTEFSSASSNCKIQINIENDSCWFSTVLVDMIPALDQLYNGTGGYIKIDKKLWKKGILKAEFYCTCVHSANPEDTHYWKGIILVDLKGPSQKK